MDDSWRDDKRIARLLACLMVVLLFFFVSAVYALHHHRLQVQAENRAPRYGVVQLDKVVPKNPSYAAYEKAKKEYEAMQTSYMVESQDLNRRSLIQSKALASIGDAQGITNSLNTEIAAKMDTKRAELLVPIHAKRDELYKKYENEMMIKPSALDLQIVNLQLEINADVHMIPLNKEQVAQVKADKAAKEKKLEELLAQRKQPISGNVKAIEKKVAQDLAPMYQQMDKEWAAYGQQLREEMAQRRQSLVSNQMKTQIQKDALPNPMKWNLAWSKKLWAKKAEVDAMHESILEDIRMRVAVIAKEKGLTMVWTNTMGTDKDVVDITNDVLATYQ